MNKPFSPSAERNRDPILNVLRQELSSTQLVLEIGSGTGQHACYFANALPHLTWQPTELKHNIAAVNSWISTQKLDNILGPLELDVDVQPWPVKSAQACFTCNTFHIVSMDSVRAIFGGAKSALKDGGKLCVYGPFSINGKHTSAGNEQFDQQLRLESTVSGIRDLTELDKIAQSLGFTACRKIEMPANNLLVVWEISLQQS